MSKRTGRPKGAPPDMAWSRYYQEARGAMAFRYGLRRIPVDCYKEQRALGHDPQQAASNIYRQMQARGEL